MAIASDEPGASKPSGRLAAFGRLVSSNLLDAELLAAVPWPATGWTTTR